MIQLATMQVTVRYNDDITDADDIATELDKIFTMEEPQGILEEIGSPTISEFEVTISHD